MKEKFIEDMADILEVEANELTVDTDFREKRFDFNSLKGYAMIVMMEEEFGKEVEVDDFIAAVTVGDLINLCK